MSDDEEDVWRRDDVVKPHLHPTQHNGNGSGDIDDTQKKQLPPPPPYPPPTNGDIRGQTTTHRPPDHHSQHHSDQQQKHQQKQRHSQRGTSTRGAVEHYNNRKANRKNGHTYSDSGGGGWHGVANGGRKRGRSSSFNHDGGRTNNDFNRGGGGRYRGNGKDRSGPNNRGATDYNTDRSGPNNRPANGDNAGNDTRTRYQQPRQHPHNIAGEDEDKTKGEGQGGTRTGSPSHHHNRPTHNQHHHHHGRRPNYDNPNNNSQTPQGVPQSNGRMSSNRTESSLPPSSGFGNINVSIPPPPPFPPPMLKDGARNRHHHRHHHASPPNRTTTDKRGRGSWGDSTERSEPTAPAATGGSGGGAGADPTKTLLLSGIPPHVTDHDVRQYFTHEWQMHVTSVVILPADRGAVPKDGGDGEVGGTVPPTPPTAAGGEGPGPGSGPGGAAGAPVTVVEDDELWYEAHVELSTRREAYLIANYPWKPWDALILGIDSILIEGVLHDHPRFCRGDAEGRGPRLPTPIVRRPPPTEQQRLRHRRHKELRTGLQTLRNKKKELEQREEVLGQQLKLHQRMLSMMKDKGTSNDVASVSYRAKKTKEILEKVTGVRNMVLNAKREVRNEIDPEIKKLEGEEETLRLEMEAAAAAAALAARVSIVRPFQLDRRTTVLRVEGLAKDAPLEEVRVLFSGYGAVTNVEWLVHESDQEKNDKAEEESSSEPTAVSPLPPTLLVHCANRGVAERIRANCRQYNSADLTFTWHCGTTEKPPGAVSEGMNPSVTIGNGGGAILEDVTAMENSVVEVDSGGGGGDGTGDRSLYWTEDDDLMVDYDDEEG